MRPVTKRPVSEVALFARPSLSVLIDMLGPYCSYSERPLFDVAGVWNVEAGRSHPPEAPASDVWDRLLLLDVNTHAAALASAPAAPKMLRPDKDLTFAVSDASPFAYALEQITTIYLDDDGRPDGDPSSEKQAIVRGRTEAAQATIDAFALNTPFFDAATNVVRIKRSDYLSMVDTRLQERTRAWTRAAAAADAAAALTDPATRRLLLNQIRLAASATGYWSVWATVLWQRFHDSDMLRRVLMPAPAPAALAFAAREAVEAVLTPIGAGPHNAFPGTRSDWLT